jgi:murein DD-endopeptidase MepM/ murein hydrolase activator NlpD
MANDWVKYLVQGLFILILYNGCGLFQSEELDFEEQATVTVTNLVEIEEQLNLDEYGFQVQNLIKEGWVQPNESIYTILSEFGVSPQKIYELDRASRGVFSSNSLRQGQPYLLYQDPLTDEVNRMIIQLNILEYVVFDWADKVWVDRGQKEIQTEVVETSGSIQSSLYQALVDNDVNPLLGSKLSEIFGWQIDFFSLQKNDTYKIIYEQQYVDGTPFGVGEIIAANFNHKGNSYKAFYFETEERAGYFDENGNGLQKALLKAPFKYSQRVSSGFSYNRFHPVLGQKMPHYGVDYAAPLGTPVIAVGDGEIVEARYRGSNGNIVKIRHNSVYTTAYLHLNAFAPSIKIGRRVKQGQVIGYVGKTGRVTGVHLDYRMYKHGQPLNPLKVELPPSKSLKGDELAEFKLYIERYKFRLSQMNSDLLASTIN